MMLKLENERLKFENKVLKGIIGKATEAARQIITEAEAKLAGSQPRGTWALWRGRGEAARLILKRLK